MRKDRVPKGLAIDEVPEGWGARAWYQHLKYMESVCVNETNLCEIRKRLKALEGDLKVRMTGENE